MEEMRETNKDVKGILQDLWMRSALSFVIIVIQIGILIYSVKDSAKKGLVLSE